MGRKTAARSAGFSVANGILKVEGDLHWERLGEFEAACNRLLAARGGQLTLDLGSVSFVASSFIGSIASLVLLASGRRRLVNIKVGLDTSWIFEIMGGGKTVKLEIV